MGTRTDLAIELEAEIKEEKNGIIRKTKILKDIKLTKIEIVNGQGEKIIGCKKGKYITVEFPDILKLADYSILEEVIAKALVSLLPQNRKTILVVGLGNREIGCDNIGPETASKILATRHIVGDFAKQIGLNNLRSVSVITTDVLGKTGLESTEICQGVVKKIKPDAVIAIDALAAKSVSRLFKTVQLTNTGISPGSGVKNARKELSEQTLGVPVIAMGVPSAVDAVTLSKELTGHNANSNSDLIVTPKDCDLLSHRISEILARALNVTLQPEIPPEILFDLV